MTRRTRSRDSALDWLALGLTTVGALNWGLVGLFNVNLVTAIFGKSRVSRIVYSLVGLAGAWLLVNSARES